MDLRETCFEDESWVEVGQNRCQMTGFGITSAEILDSVTKLQGVN
jgi:hypothetical protein